MSATPKNAEAVAKKWSANLAAAGDSIKAGVQAVTQAPGEKAANRKDAYLAGVQRSVDKWAANVRAVSLSSWKDSMLQKGLPHIAEGARLGKDKYMQFYRDFGNYLSLLEQQLASQPRGTLEQNIQRMITTVRFLHDYPIVRGGNQ